VNAALEAATAVVAPRRLYIDGDWRSASSRRNFGVEDPATGATICDVADATADDAQAALDAATRVQREWAATAPDERAEILLRAHALLRSRADELARVMTLEMGKALRESKAEIEYSAEFFRWFAGAAQRIDGSFKTGGPGGFRVLVMRQPVGPCYFITPWNFPTAMGARKIAPAIAAGCTMVVKPAHQTPLSMLALAELLAESGLPPGVLNVIPTTSPAPVAERLLSDRRLRKLSFTGSTDIGRKLLGQATENVLRVSMELGGNAPFLVFEDADLDAAVAGALVAKMRNLGEACTAANRFYVAESIGREFSDRLAAGMSALRVGPGIDPDSDVGPLVDSAQRDRIARLVDDALERGAELLTGGCSGDGPGYFYEPTVLMDVHPRSRVMREEVFGPVASIRCFSSTEEAIEAANGTDHGLAAYVYTNDLRRALLVSERLESGMVGLNRGLVSSPGAPFGGVKQSGLGREGGDTGIDEYLETKYVAVDL
jgi:succinate-semialdehyde dehydrogenase / glutarate-semialdehyde dehydrogenase